MRVVENLNNNTNIFSRNAFPHTKTCLNGIGGSNEDPKLHPWNTKARFSCLLGLQTDKKHDVYEVTIL